MTTKEDISNVKIAFNNRHNPEYEVMFDDLIQDVFGFSFSPWFERKLWDEHYESYSVIENGRMLSNVCIYKSNIVVQGKTVMTNRFGAVATRKDMQGKGLSRLLMEHILSLYPNTLSLLTANPSVIDFYPRFGFKQVQTYTPEIAVNINNNQKKAIKYSLDDPDFMTLLYNRNQYSNIVDCISTQSIQIFHLLMEYADDIYYLPNLDVAVVAQQDGSNLYLADVIARKPISFESLKQELPFENIESVEFGFTPDWLDVTPTWTPVNMNDDPFFIKGEWNLPTNYCFPAMSET
ncbi:MAG: GNAT family N-acetyltransferase [Oscillospiraceae bacterium]|nr:GNAT family N-acetyltransferase [Oscillospiraceae bacterium]